VAAYTCYATALSWANEDFSWQPPDGINGNCYDLKTVSTMIEQKDPRDVDM